MANDLDRHITGNYGEDSVASDGACIWEDCDQDAIYCAGHALEFSNVSSENEAIRLRAERDELLAALRDAADFIANPGIPYDHSAGRRIVDTVRAAIAKLEGRS